VQVVGVVQDGHEALGLDGGEVGAVGLDGALVGAGGVVPAADPRVDVRRHVEHVADLDVELDEPVGRALGALGPIDASTAWM
jgi:hypothetical protein